MRNSLCLGLLAAATLITGAAFATPIGVGNGASSVIDVDFWGRRQIRQANPNDPTEDIISYGEPVRGSFRIWTEDAPAPNRTSYFLNYDDAVVYGRDVTPVGNPPPASFVTSRWLSPFPNTPLPGGFTGDVSPLPPSIALDGGDADDYVTIGDAVLFRRNEPLKDWFQVHDGYTAFMTDPPMVRRNALAISISTPTDIIQGLGLNQEFEVDLQGSEDRGYGYFQNTIERHVVAFYDFVVDRVRVSKHRVCRP